MHLTVTHSVIAFESRAIVSIEKGNDLTLARRFLFADENEVAAVNTCVDHGITAGTQKEEISATGQSQGQSDMLKLGIGHFGEGAARNGITHLHTVGVHQLAHILGDDATVSVVFDLALLLHGFEVSLNGGTGSTEPMLDLTRGGRPAVILKVFIHKIDDLAEQ